jgi:hypothetical protein
MFPILPVLYAEFRIFQFCQFTHDFVIVNDYQLLPKCNDCTAGFIVVVAVKKSSGQATVS